MSEENLAVVNAHFQAIVNGDFKGLEDCLADDYVTHTTDGDFPGKQAQVDRLKNQFKTTYTDDEFTILDQFAAGDKVVTRISVTCTHMGDWFGVPATGRRVTQDSFHIARVENGKVAETWRMSDDLGVLRQIGATTVPQ
jgi:steroid delta-isomerase-like uncharacterized protein